MTGAAVVDASVAMKWVVEEPGSERARQLSEVRLRAPDVLLIECANALWKKALRGELSKDSAAARLAVLSDAPVTVHSSAGLMPAALEMAIELRHPVYDCLYLALAAQNGIPLVTADNRFAETVRAREGMPAEVEILDHFRS